MLRRCLAAVALLVGLLAALPALAAPAQDFTLRDVDGKPFTLSEHKGKVIVISFWATWCGPCKEEMPHLQRLYAQHGADGLLVVSISTDDARTASKVKPFVHSKGFTYPVLLDRDSSVTGVYNPSKTLPWTVVIDKDFQVAETHAGFDPGDEVKLAATVRRLLGK